MSDFFPTTAAGEHRTDVDGLVGLKTCFPSSLFYVQVVIDKALEPFFYVEQKGFSISA